MKQRKPKVKVNIYMELSTQDRCIHLANGGTLRWHTPLSTPFNRGRLCKNEGRTMQNCSQHTGGLQDPRKKTWKMKERKPKVKVSIYMELSTQDRCIHLANGGTLRWHTPSPDHSIGEDYAKMKAEPCKIVENTREDCRTHEKTMNNEAAQAKSEGQHIHGAFHTRQVHTSCKWGHTKMSHTLSRPFNRGRLCKNEGRTMQNCRKHTGGLQDPRKNHEKWSSASQKWRSTYTWSFPHKTGAYILQMGAH